MQFINNSPITIITNQLFDEIFDDLNAISTHQVNYNNHVIKKVINKTEKNICFLSCEKFLLGLKNIQNQFVISTNNVLYNYCLQKVNNEYLFFHCLFRQQDVNFTKQFGQFVEFYKNTQPQKYQLNYSLCPFNFMDNPITLLNNLELLYKKYNYNDIVLINKIMKQKQFFDDSIWKQNYNSFLQIKL